MFSPNEQQIEICLLKLNLEEIENDLVTQRSSLPALDTENEQKYRETMAALRIARSLNAEIERLKQENVRLTAKRMQLKRQCEDISRTLEVARAKRCDIADSLKQEEQEIELQIRQYEDSLREKADRFRQTRGFYNEEEMNIEIDEANSTIVELEAELGRRQNDVDQLRRQLDELRPEVPEDLLAFMGKMKLNEQLTELTEKYEALVEKRKYILNQK